MNAKRGLAVLMAVFINAVPKSAQAQIDAATSELVSDACDVQVLFLGEEANHGGGNSFNFKSSIVRELVLQCGVSHVVFESQFYDFLDLQDKYVAGTATIEGLYDAIGAKWSRFAEIDELVTFLHREALAGRITISGMDPQAVGAMNYYSQTSLGTRLGSALAGSRQAFCVAQFDRLNGWSFDGDNPKSPDFDEAILDCAEEIENESRSRSARDPALYQMARSYRAFLDFSNDDSRDSWNRRDQQMYENLAWSIARLPGDTKTLVWTATNHALRDPYDGRDSVASHAVREGLLNIASVAVIAVGGTRSTPDGRRVEIPAANAESLEGRFMHESATDAYYVDESALQLLGTVASRVIGYTRYTDLNWDTYLDGVLVIPSEAPPTSVRPPQPLQIPP